MDLRKHEDNLSRQLFIAENNWLMGGFASSESYLQSILIDFTFEQLHKSLGLDPSQCSGFNESSAKFAADPTAFLSQWLLLQPNAMSVSDISRLDIRNMFIGFSPDVLPLECAWFKAIVKDLVFESKRTLPHYCVSPSNNWKDKCKEFLSVAPSITFYLGPYMCVSTGHVGYILFVVAAISYMRAMNINASLVLLGSFQSARTYPIVEVLLKNSFVSHKQLSRMTLTDHVGYLLRGDAAAFFHCSKYIEAMGYASIMGYGQKFSIDQLGLLEPFMLIRQEAKELSRNHAAVGIHTRTHEYKRDAHMDLRNSSLSSLVEAIVSTKKFEGIDIVGVYSDAERAELANKTVNGLTINVPSDHGVNDLLFSCGCDRFIGTSSGPAHIAAYFCPTLFLNSTTFHVSEVVFKSVTISFQNVLLTPVGLKTLTRDALFQMLISDRISSLSNYFILQQLNTAELQSEILSWMNGEGVYLSSIVVPALALCIYSDVLITPRTKSMLESILDALPE